MKKIVVIILFTLTGTYAQTDAVRFKAVIENRNSDSLFIRKQKFERIIPVDDKGVFTDSFSVEPGMYQLFDGVEYTSLYLKNGYNLTLTMDAVMFDESIVYTGKGEKENNYLAKKALDDEEFGIKLIEALHSDIEGVKELTKARKEKIEAALNDKDLDEKFKEEQKKQLLAENREIDLMVLQAHQKLSMKGKPSPSFEYENHKGGKTSLADLKGKWVYIDVWATWCGPCIMEIPYLQELEKKFHGKKIAFVSISVDPAKDKEKWKKFVTNKSLGGIQLFADNNFNSDFIKAYSINSIPRFILLDPNGNIVDADALRPSYPDLEKELNALLQKK